MWSGRKIAIRGFSLVELLVVMSLIAILAGSLSILSINRNLGKGRDSKRQSDLEGLRSALEQYRYDNGKYITSTGGDAGSVLSVLPTGYLGALPSDPASGNYYYYLSPTTSPGSYQLCARLDGLSVTPTPNACGAGTLCGSGSGAYCNYQVTNP